MIFFADTGRFVSKNSAIKANISIISFGLDFWASPNTLMAGGNFYINDSLPSVLYGGVMG